MSDEERLRRQLWVGIALLHLTAAVFTKGYHHPDEHFQILEFAHHKLAGTSGAELAWEYEARIRPWLQPAMCAGIIRVLQAVGVANPFTHVLILRLLAAALGLASIVVLAKAAKEWVINERAYTWLVAALGLAWFVPYLHARTSSENLATCMICFAIAAVIWSAESRWWGFIAGLCAGASFEARFQMGFMIAGIAAWVLYNKQWQLLWTATVGLVLVLILGRFIDHWGYGDWTLTPLAYFRVNVVEAKASSFGVQPWWWYFRKLVSETPPPMGILLILLTPLAWWRGRKNVITWATIPFFFAHVAVAHKELRFLFPLGPLLTLLIVTGLQDIRVPMRAWVRTLVVVMLVPNAVYLLVNCIKPVRGEVLVLEEIYARQREATDLYVIDVSPFYYRELIFGFFDMSGIELHYIDDYAQFDTALARADAPLLLYISNNWLPAAASHLAPRCHVVHRSFPEWIGRFNFKNWLQRTYQALLLECR